MAGVADCGVDSAVGNADNDICLNRMLKRKAGARIQPCRMHADSVNNGIRPCKIDVFKNTYALFCLAAMVFYGAHAVFLKNDDFSRLNISDERCADRIKSTGLRGNNIAAVARLTVAERSEAVFVTHGNEL